MAGQALAGESAEPVAFDFGGWMMAEQKRVFLLCYRLLRDRDEADAASQDAFVKAWQALEKGAAGIEDHGKWITRIAVNTCVDRIRSRTWKFWTRRPAPESEQLILAQAPAHEPTAEDRVLGIEIERRIGEAMLSLSARQRAVFALRHYEQRSIEETAGILGLDRGTVKAHAARATAKLREELRDLYGLA